MAYNKISQATISKVEKRYGQNSKEFRSINLLADSRIPYECIAEALRLDPDATKTDLTGGIQLPENEHVILHNAINVLIVTALKRGLLPCKDNVVITPILEMLLFMEQANRQINALRQSANGE